jgi:hypothetical protein
MATQDALKLTVSLDKFGSLAELLIYLVRTNGPRKDEALAQQLGATKSHLSEVLNEKGKHWPEPWVKHVARTCDPEHLIARYVARWQGLEVRPPRTISDAAWRRASDRVLRRHNGVGESLRAEIEQEAFAEPETEDAP